MGAPTRPPRAVIFDLEGVVVMPGRAEPIAGLPAFLDALERAGVPCAVATSAARVDAHRLLGRVGLAPRFAAVVTADDVRRGKPDPEVYAAAAAALGIVPGECLVFEDALVGVQAALAAGMRVIGVATTRSADALAAAGAARVIRSFEELRWPV